MPPARRLLPDLLAVAPSDVAASTLLASVPDPLLVLDPQGTIVYASAACHTLVGSKTFELTGTHWSHLFVAAEHERLTRKLQRLAAGPGGAFREDVVLRCGGGPRVVELAGSSVEDPTAGRLVLVSMRDVTARREAETELRARADREMEARAQAEQAEHRAAFLAELVSLLDASLDYRATLTNVARLVVPALADYCLIDEATDGYGSRRVAVAHVDPVSELLLEANASHPPGSDPTRHPVLQVIRSGEPVLVAETPPATLEEIAHDEEHLEKLKRLDVHGYMIVPLVARGRTLGTLSLVSSISRRRFTEQDVEIAVAVARRSALAIDNARLYSRAQQALHARDEVLAFVSHDLRNPLATILLNASALLDLVPNDRLLPDQREQLEWIAHSSEQMNRLIQDLLEVSRAESGTIPLDLRKVDPADLLWEAVLTLQSLALEKGVKLEVDDVPADLIGWMDRERVLRVLGNLVGNSIKFTPAGGEVTLRLRKEDDDLRYSVRDTGIGIAPEDQERVLQGYWRRTPGGGSGLGLTIARRIVEAHGGRLWFTSVPGEGSTFYFTIPARRRENG